MDTPLTRINNMLGKFSLLMIFIAIILFLIGNYVSEAWNVIGSWFFNIGVVVILLLFILFGVDAYLQYKAEQDLPEE